MTTRRPDADEFVAGVACATPASQARFVPCTAKGPVQRRDGNVLLDDRDALALGVTRESALYLGRRGDTDYYTANVDSPLPDGFVARSLRASLGALSDGDLAVVSRAVQICAWDDTHRRCGRCGEPTVRSATQRVRTCEACGLGAWPRLAPAVIVLVERDDGRVLLAHARGFPLPMYSTLAGFVEPGESLEDCVHREIEEEAGVRVDDLRDFGSQPWPFPHSLMVGFHARYASGELRIDEEELVHADWFARDALPAIPPSVSIARRLIDDWLARA